MASRSLLLLLLLLLVMCSSFSFVEGGSDKKKKDHKKDNKHSNDTMNACTEKLSPCQPFMKEKSNQTPPIKCCKPLQQLSKIDMKCVCDFINPLNKTIGIPERHVLKGCKVKVDCKTPNSSHHKHPPAKYQSGSGTNITPNGITFLGVVAAFAALMA